MVVVGRDEKIGLLLLLLDTTRSTLWLLLRTIDVTRRQFLTNSRGRHRGKKGGDGGSTGESCDKQTTHCVGVPMFGTRYFT